MLSQLENRAVIYWKLFITLFMSNGNKLIPLLFLKSFKASQWPMIYSWKYSHISKVSWMLAWIIKGICVICSHCSLFSYSKRHQSSTYRALEHNDYSIGSDRCFVSSCRVFWSMLVTKKGRCSECCPRYQHCPQVKGFYTHQLGFALYPEIFSKWQKDLLTSLPRWKPLEILDKLQMYSLAR